MTRKYMPLLREATHAALMAENLAVPMRGRNAPLPDEVSEIRYLALGEPAAKIELHLDNQRNSMPWERHWICDPTHPNSVKVIAFVYRSVAESAISMYAEFGVPTIEVTESDLPFLVEDFHQILLAAEDRDPVLLVVGLRLGLVQEWLRRHRHDEIVQCLKDPKSARHACWLLNERDKLFGRKVVADINELAWSLRVTEWDILQCKAVHPDGNAIFFEGEWRFMPLTNFWRRYCNPALSPHRDLPDIWRLELKLANRPREEVVLSDDDDEDLAVFI
ncbi:hypothetical protein [Bradyrhizobium sp. JYMT SZCCT0180]|uniref:hypothetical protein n=1 Tax=Bradyrhizobium sp. JYMT SZCCT0180 TaxID=2807666 RepID=UPI001BABF8B6|nr:hypothetical protein [Bradyrhizobium sp. JYMT SZCCT0180]MBR1214594.1 hypothetical protein [Bradyrhizobium sp. JYMT SZCCT0180]